MYQFEVQGDIEARVSSQSVCHLHRLWMRFHAAASDLPAFADLCPERLQWCAANLMVVEPIDGDDFVYRYYGSGIAHAARFDMTGKRVGDFRSDVGRFFREKYRRCLDSGRPLYTVHRATHVATVHTWERLLLPVRDERGPLIVALNQPMAFRHEFLQGVLESTSIGILFAAALHRDGSGNEPVQDFQILSSNVAAARLLGRPDGSLAEQTLSEILPEVLRGRIQRLCFDVFESSAPATVRVSGVHNGVERVIQASGVRSGDGVTLVLSEATRLEALEVALEDMEQDLNAERKARLRLESRLRAMADASLTASLPRRADLLAALEVEVEKATSNDSSLSLLLLGLETPGGSVARSLDANDDVLGAVLRLCQGMLRRGDWTCRAALTDFAAILPQTTDEVAHEIASRIVEAVAIRFRSEPMLSARITLGAGLASWVPGQDAGQLLARAESALDEAKGAGRGQVRRAST